MRNNDKISKRNTRKVTEMDEQVTLVEQMNEDTGRPVILVNKFNVNPDEVDMFLMDWEKDATYLGASLNAFLRNFIKVLEGVEIR